MDMYHMYGPRFKPGIEAWQSLVHVCRRWRSLVFESPRHLNLQLVCTPETPTKDTLDIWPASGLPLVVIGDMNVPNMTSTSGVDNISAALRQSNRVCQVGLSNITYWQMEEFLATMQVPFPELTFLWLSSCDDTPPPIPDSFLGGSAPRLRNLSLLGIPFPGLSNLLLTATHLVDLRLEGIGYILPQAMASFLSVMSGLKTLCLTFLSSQSLPDWKTQNLPPPKRSVLPVLDTFRFKCVAEYLEDLMTFIEAPQVKTLEIALSNQINFDCPRLAQFINCTATRRAHDEARVRFESSTVFVNLRYRTSGFDFDDLMIKILCREPNLLLSSVRKVCNSLHPLSTVEVLHIEHRCGRNVWKDVAIENTLWVQLLLPYTAAKKLYISEEFAPGIVAALQELVGSRITEVLPSLQLIVIEGVEPAGRFQENIAQFDTVRQNLGHPAISIMNERDCTA